MQDKTYLPFSEEMRKDYTILIPNMLPMHFKLIISILKPRGFNLELLETEGPDIAETGLRYTHNDTCYPAILVIGQFMQALQSGKYDPDRTALLLTQTGGGCRASNYISLIRKALDKAGMSQVPVIGFGFVRSERHPGFRLPLGVMRQLIYAVTCGDLLMTLVNQTKPYELHKGDAAATAEDWIEKLGTEFSSSRLVTYGRIKSIYREIIGSFKRIPTEKRDKVKVGIVGEIFVKYSPLGNNNLEDFLLREGAQTVVPGLLDFCLYCIYDDVMDYKIYKKGFARYLASSFAAKYLIKKRNDVTRALDESGVFESYTPFENVIDNAGKLINTAVKMGEGWLLTAEMLELAESGCDNIVCTQPFGCLPNHICGKGMMKPIKQLCPDVNIVAIDYDAGASRVNQENRLKLMMANAKSSASSDT